MHFCLNQFYLAIWLPCYSKNKKAHKKLLITCRKESQIYKRENKAEIINFRMHFIAKSKIMLREFNISEFSIINGLIMNLFKFFELPFSFQNRIYYYHWLSSRISKGKPSSVSVGKAYHKCCTLCRVSDNF